MALFISIYTIKHSQKHDRLSVKPYLQDFKKTKKDKTPTTDKTTNLSGQLETTSIIIILKNAGLGPAIIKSFEVYFNGALTDINNSDVMREHIKKHLSPFYPENSVYKRVNMETTHLQKGTSIVADDEYTILRIQYPTVFSIFNDTPHTITYTSEDTVQKIDDLISRYDLYIAYESIYGESLVYDSRKK